MGEGDARGDLEPAALLDELVRTRDTGLALEVAAARDDVIVTVLDAGWRVVWSSRTGGARILGLDAIHLEGEPALDYVHPEDVPTVERALEEAATGRAVDWVSRAQDADGRWLRFRHVGWGVDEGATARIVVVVTPLGGDHGQARASRRV